MTYNGLINKVAKAKINGLYQKEIAQKSKISQQRLSLILKGKTEPTKKELENFAIYFGCGLDGLVEVDKVNFKGIMRITPKNENIPSFNVKGDWVYKEEYKCWYCGNNSYPEEICSIISKEE